MIGLCHALRYEQQVFNIGTLAGLVSGMAVTLVGLGLFALLGDRAWVLRMTQVSAGLGYWAMRDWYTGFPVSVSLGKTNTLLVLAGGMQWGLVELLCDLCRAGLRRMPSSN